MIQILEVENLVAMSQIEKSKPMDIVEQALADSMQWIRLDKNLNKYTKEFVQTKHKKEQIHNPEKTKEQKREHKKVPVEKEKIVELTKRDLQKTSVKAEFNYLPVRPEPEIAKKVKEAI